MFYLNFLYHIILFLSALIHRIVLICSDAFGAIPARPTELRSRGMIVHLISPVEGTVNRINHEEEIKSLPSFVCMHLEPGVGDAIVKTVNIRTDSGYVLLQHPDPEVVEADYRRVVELQSSIFEVETEGGVVDSYMGSLDDNNQAHSTGISFNQGVHNIDDFGHRQNENIENQSLSMPQQLSLSEKVKTAVKDNVDKILKDLKRVDVQSLIRSVATQIHRSNVGLTAVRSMRAIPFTVAKILGKAAVLVTLYALIAYSLAILSTSPPLKNLRL